MFADRPVDTICGRSRLGVDDSSWFGASNRCRFENGRQLSDR